MAAETDKPDWDALCAHPQVVQLIDLAVAEDVGSGDVTTQAVLASPQPVRGHIIARKPTIVCGVPLAGAILRRFDPNATVTAMVLEGVMAAADQPICAIGGDVAALLTAERCVLNFLMHLCGVATRAHAAHKALDEVGRAQVFDTRKTTPGFRLLDKAAVVTGGAQNHRVGLFDGVLIKDNHVQAAGSVADAVRLAREHSSSLPVEVEVDRLDQLEEAIDAGAAIVLLDNFSLAEMRQAVEQANGRVILEASGGITIDDLAAVAETGVDRISMGALTHTIEPADLSFELL